MGLAASYALVRNRQLRKLMTAWAAFYTGDISHALLVVVFAFSAGGPPVVGVATVLNVLPGGLLGPVAATLATSVRPQLHLAIGIGARALVMIATIIAVLTGAPVLVVLALVAADSLVSATVRPLHGALVVRLAGTAAEAAAANSATSSLLSASALIGPALTGPALGLFGIGWAFALPAVVFAAGTAAALLIVVQPRADDEPETTDPRPSQSSVRAQLSAVAAGFRAILASRPATGATTLFVVNVALLGVLFVAVASVAIGRLGLGEGGVATIMTLFGAGGLLGGLATLSIVERPGLARVLAVAMLCFAVTLAGLGAILTLPPALTLAAGAGAASAVAYAVAPTLVQRNVAPTGIVPAAASLHSLYLVGIATGATIAPMLIESLGVPAALGIMGGAAALITALVWPQLRRADALSAEDAAKLAVVRAPDAGLAAGARTRAARPGRNPPGRAGPLRGRPKRRSALHYGLRAGRRHHR